MKIYIDEAGRGPLAGPVYVGLVSVLKKIDKSVFFDSKKCSAKKRLYLYDEIKNYSNKYKILYSYGSCDNKIIDKYGIIYAINKAIRKGIRKIYKKYIKFENISYDKFIDNVKLIIDGNNDFLLKDNYGFDVKTIIKGDDKIKEISMASIIAKVERDNFMIKIGKKYKFYGFDKHKGYGTKFHCKIIKKLGMTDIHRISFCKTLFD